MQIGMIGLGRMGANMARRLIRKGHSCVVFNRSPQAVNELVKEKAIGAVSLADLLVAPQIGFFTQTPEWAMLSAPHPNLVAWLARMEARPSMKATTWERVSEMAKAA